MATRNERIAFNIFINDREAGKTIKQLRQESRKLSNEINNNLTPGTKEYNRAVKQLRGLNTQIQTHRNKVKGLGGAWSSVKKEIRGFGILLLASLGFQKLFQGIDNLIQRNAQLDDSYRDVAKTTGLSVEQVKELSGELKKIDTRTARKDLLALAEVAGKLGKKGKKEITGFVRAADKINVALGKDLGGNIENTIRQLGKINELFGAEQEYGTEESLIKVGSAINALGASSTANEEYLVEFTKRLGGVGNQAGFSIDEILGLAATLDQLGQTSETSTTSISKLLVKIGKEVETFAEIAGVSTEQFTKLLEEDANEALLLLLEGSKSTKGGVEGLAITLDKLGIDGSRAAGVLGALSSNTELLKEQQKLAADEYRKGTSIIDEFNQKNEGLAANLDKIRKALAGKFINSGIVNALGSIVNAGAKYLSIPLATKLESERKAFSVLVTQIELAGDNHERRNTLIQELQSEYPQYLENINTETVTNQELRNILQQVNKEYIAKIILAKKQEEIKKIAEQEAKAVEKLANNYTAVAEAIDNISEKTGFERLIDENADDYIKRFRENFEIDSREFYAAYKDLLKIGQIKAGDLENKQKNAINAIQSELEKAKEEAILFEEQLNKILGLRDKTIEIEVVTTETGADIDTKDITTTTEDDTAAEEAAAKAAEIQAQADAERLAAIERLNETIEKYKVENELKSLESDERELEQIRNKYAALIEVATKHDQETKDIETLRDEELAAKKQEHYERDLLAQQDYLNAVKELEFQFREERAIVEDDEALKIELNEEEELIRLEETYSKLLERLKTFQDSKVISAEQAEIELTRIKELYEKQRFLIENKYSNKKLALETKVSNDEIKLAEENRVARLQAAGSLVNSLSGLFGELADDSSEFAAFQKALALVEIGINTAVAIASATKAGAGEPFPYNLAAITAGISGVTAAIATAKSSFSNNSIPKYAEGGPTGDLFSSNTGMPSFKGGGMLYQPTLALAGERGPEYIVPNWQLQDPESANLVRILETRRLRKYKAYAEGGSTGEDIEVDTTDNNEIEQFNESITTATNDMVMIEMFEVMKKISDRFDEPIEASINNDRLLENEERLSVIDPNYSS